MVTRLTASAFLVCKDRVLLMKRGEDRRLAPGLWAGVGGHMDIDDITDPRALPLQETCLREVREEAGIDRADIANLKLKYITMRRAGEEIRSNYYYIGEVEAEFTLPRCEEGELHWVAKRDLPDLPMSLSAKTALKHWLANPYDGQVLLVVVNAAGDRAEILGL